MVGSLMFLLWFFSRQFQRSFGFLLYSSHSPSSSSGNRQLQASSSWAVCTGLINAEKQFKSNLSFAVCFNHLTSSFRQSQSQDISKSQPCSTLIWTSLSIREVIASRSFFSGLFTISSYQLLLLVLKKRFSLFSTMAKNLSVNQYSTKLVISQT